MPFSIKVVAVVTLLLAVANLSSAADPSYLSSLIEKARAERVASERPWRTLLHYKGAASQADGPGFFLSPAGKRDAAAELDADLRAFFDETEAVPEPRSADQRAPGWSSAQTAQCRFPARYFWLKRRLAIDPSRLPDQPCERFDAWRAAIGADGVTLVFADAFLNNPASMYGHTFLRLRRAGAPDGLLDYTINFAGNPDDSGALFYAVKGIVGAFPGTYSTQPYYMKIQEYNNIASRDLWEYDLNLSSQTVAQLMRHAWEMGSTFFDYFFFSENCSYQLLTLLDGADPSLHLSDSFGFAAIPADTVRAVVVKRGLASARRYRPSHLREMLARRAALTPQERELARRAGRFDASADAGLEALAPERRAAALDSAYDYVRYLHGFQDVPKPELAAAERKLLLARGRLGQPPSAVTPAEPAPLEAGHETARVSLGGGVSKHGIYQEAAFRYALHDLAADSAGYAEGSQLEMGHVRLRFDDRGAKPYVERAALVDILSLSPWDAWVRKPSWRVSAGVEQAKELGCDPADCMIGDLSVGFGLAAKPDLPARPIAFVFAEGDAGAGEILPIGWRLGLGGTAGLLLHPLPRWRLLASGTYRHFWQRSPHQERLTLTSSWTLSRNWELRAHADRRTPDSEAGGLLLFYF